MVKTKMCSVCDSSFEIRVGRGLDRKYCSTACRGVRAKERAANNPHPLCSVNECERNTRSRGASYCEAHYYRMRRSGDTRDDLPIGSAVVKKKRDATCAHCGVHLVESYRKYCTDNCMREHRRANVIQSEYPCPVCNQRFMKLPGSRRTVCSDSCKRYKMRFSQYGITLEIFRQEVDKRGGACDICEQVPNQLVIDHDHQTGLVRGYLCSDCNVGIGMLKDDLRVVQRAASYLQVTTHVTLSAVA